MSTTKNKSKTISHSPPDPFNRIPEIRLGRNFIRSGDAVRVAPSRPNRKDGFVATFLNAIVDDALEVRWVDVVGGPKGHFRSLPLSRISRVAQTKGGERREVAR